MAELLCAFIAEIGYQQARSLAGAAEDSMESPGQIVRSGVNRPVPLGVHSG
jgi:hypothetical protein